MWGVAHGHVEAELAVAEEIGSFHRGHAVQAEISGYGMPEAVQRNP